MHQQIFVVSIINKVYTFSSYKYNFYMFYMFSSYKYNFYMCISFMFTCVHAGTTHKAHHVNKQSSHTSCIRNTITFLLYMNFTIKYL